MQIDFKAMLFRNIYESVPISGQGSVYFGDQIRNQYLPAGKSQLQLGLQGVQIKEKRKALAMKSVKYLNVII